MRKTNILTAVVMLFYSLLVAESQAGILGSKNYNDCLLENIKGAGNILATYEIKKTCARKFPKTVPLDDADLIIHIVNSGILMLNSHYKAVYKEYYSDIKYEEFLRRIFDKKVKIKYQNITFKGFLERIEYSQKD